MTKLITIIGITGLQGSSVAQHFLNTPGWKVRGVSRDTESEKAKAWLAKGVEMVTGDLNKVETLEVAFKGSNAIFVVTDYATNVKTVLSNPNLIAEAKNKGKTPNEFAGELETQQGINAATIAASPSVLSTLERFIFSSLPPLMESSQGKHTKAYEFDSKAKVELYIQNHLKQLSERMSVIICGNYLENWQFIPALAPQKEKDGSYSFLWLDCPGQHTAHPELWAIKDTGRFVKSLILDHPPGIQLLASTAIINSTDYAATWSKVMGLPAQSKVVSEAEYSALVPEEIREAFIDIIKIVTLYGVGEKIKTASDLAIKPTPLEEFIKSQSWNL